MAGVGPPLRGDRRRSRRRQPAHAARRRAAALHAVALPLRRVSLARRRDGADLGSQSLARERQPGAARDGEPEAAREGGAASARSARSTSTTSCSISARAARSTSSTCSCSPGAGSSSSRPSRRRSRTPSTSCARPVYRSLRVARAAPRRGARRSAGCATNGRERRVRSAQELIALVREIDPPAAKPLEERAQAFAPMLVVNQVRSASTARVGPGLVASCRDRLGVSIELAGSIDVRSERARRGGAAAARGPGVSALPLLAPDRGARAAPAASREVPRESRASEAARAAPLRVARTPPRDADARAAARAAAARSGRARAPICAAAARRSASRLAEMTERTRIRGLDHIESERFERLPAELYLKSYVIAYARELELPDVADLAKCYLAKAPARPAQSAPLPVRSARSWWTRT